MRQIDMRTIIYHGGYFQGDLNIHIHEEVRERKQEKEDDSQTQAVAKSLTKGMLVESAYREHWMKNPKIEIRESWRTYCRAVDTSKRYRVLKKVRIRVENYTSSSEKNAI